MINFAGQEISDGDYVIQIARTNQGIIRRAGVVLDSYQADDGMRLRVAWYDPTNLDTSASESVVNLDNLVKIDGLTLPSVTRVPLEYAKIRGRAAL